MDTRYISEFVSLAETLSYSRTAHDLHLSQSSLSRHIQMMEKELGPLFIRSTRRIELSPGGRIYLPWAKKITAAQQAAEAALKQAAQGTQRRHHRRHRPSRGSVSGDQQRGPLPPGTSGHSGPHDGK
jgi:DNA-binding transcriptional LysR family regulator